MPDLVTGVLFLAPGFLALKLFYLLGAQRVRSQWEWTTWSVIASLPINGLAGLLVGPEGAARSGVDPDEIALRVLIGIVIGSLLAVGWQLVRASSHKEAARLRRAFGSSAWDEALDDVQRDTRLVELVLEDDKRYLGTIGYGGREDNEAEGWLYLIHPEVYDLELKDFRPTSGTHGYLIHRNRIKRLRILLRKDESPAAATDTDETSQEPSPRTSPP